MSPPTPTLNGLSRNGSGRNAIKTSIGKSAIQTLAVFRPRGQRSITDYATTDAAEGTSEGPGTAEDGGGAGIRDLDDLGPPSSVASATEPVVVMHTPTFPIINTFLNFIFFIFAFIFVLYTISTITIRWWVGGTLFITFLLSFAQLIIALVVVSIISCLNS